MTLADWTFITTMIALPYAAIFAAVVYIRNT